MLHVWIFFALVVVVMIEWCVKVVVLSRPMEFGLAKASVGVSFARFARRAALSGVILVFLSLWAQKYTASLFLAVMWSLWICELVFATYVLAVKLWRLYLYTEQAVSGRRPIRKTRQRF